MPQGAPQGAVPQITPQIIKDSKTFECGCGGKRFEEQMIIKKISSLLSPTGKNELFPMNILVCSNCKLVPNELNPDGMIPDEFLRKKIIK